MCFIEIVTLVCTLYVLYKGEVCALDKSRVTMPTRSSTFVTQNLIGIWDGVNSRTKPFFNAILALDSTATEIRWRRIGDVDSVTTQ